jgi:hypothetical protein
MVESSRLVLTEQSLNPLRLAIILVLTARGIRTVTSCAYTLVVRPQSILNLLMISLDKQKCSNYLLLPVGMRWVFQVSQRNGVSLMQVSYSSRVCSKAKCAFRGCELLKTQVLDNESSSRESTSHKDGDDFYGRFLLCL